MWRSEDNLFLLSELLGLNSDHQTWWQVPLFTKPSHWFQCLQLSSAYVAQPTEMCLPGDPSSRPEEMSYYRTPHSFATWALKRRQKQHIVGRASPSSLLIGRPNGTFQNASYDFVWGFGKSKKALYFNKYFLIIGNFIQCILTVVILSLPLTVPTSHVLQLHVLVIFLLTCRVLFVLLVHSCVWPSTGVWLTYWDHIFRELLSLLQQVSAALSFSARGETSSSPLSSMVNVVCLELVQVLCVLSQSPCVPKCNKPLVVSGKHYFSVVIYRSGS